MSRGVNVEGLQCGVNVHHLLSSPALKVPKVVGRHELAAREGVKYVAAVDAAGGGPDAFTFAIVHVEGAGATRRIVQDVMRGWSKPRSGEANLEGAVAEIAGIAKAYRVSVVQGDRYAKGWVREALRWDGRGIPFVSLTPGAASVQVRVALVAPHEATADGHASDYHQRLPFDLAPALSHDVADQTDAAPNSAG